MEQPGIGRDLKNAKYYQSDDGLSLMAVTSETAPGAPWVSITKAAYTKALAALQQAREAEEKAAIQEKLGRLVSAGIPAEAAKILLDLDQEEAD